MRLKLRVQVKVKVRTLEERGDQEDCRCSLRHTLRRLSVFHHSLRRWTPVNTRCSRRVVFAPALIRSFHLDIPSRSHHRNCREGSRTVQPSKHRDLHLSAIPCSQSSLCFHLRVLSYDCCSSTIDLRARCHPSRFQGTKNEANSLSFTYIIFFHTHFSWSLLHSLAITTDLLLASVVNNATKDRPDHSALRILPNPSKQCSKQL